MKKLLIPLIGLLLTGCSFVGSSAPPLFRDYLTPDAVTLDVVRFGSGSVAVVANGTRDVLTGVSLRLDGVKAQDVLGAIECEQVNESAICKIDRRLDGGEGTSLFLSGRPDYARLAFIKGQQVQTVEGRIR